MFGLVVTAGEEETEQYGRYFVFIVNIDVIFWGKKYILSTRSVEFVLCEVVLCCGRWTGVCVAGPWYGAFITQGCSVPCY